MPSFNFESEFDPSKYVADEQFKAPDLIGTVEGWRAWGVPRELPRYGNDPKLYSVSHTNYYWAPRRESVAECAKCGPRVPGESCTCGFYSAKNLEHLMQMGYHNYDVDRTDMFRIVGQVANWGKVIEGTQGWRAQKSYPVRLFVPYEAWELAKPLSEAYGVPVRLENVLAKRKRG